MGILDMFVGNRDPVEALQRILNLEKEEKKHYRITEELESTLRNIVGKIERGEVQLDPKTKKEIFAIIGKIEEDIRAAEKLSENLALKLQRLPAGSR
jgi:hypothetical protein